jgi:hypothetical protein
MTRDLRTRRGRVHERAGRPDRMFAARRAVFSLVVFGILLVASIVAVLAGIDRHPDPAGAGTCPSVRTGNPSCAAAQPAFGPAAGPR